MKKELQVKQRYFWILMIAALLVINYMSINYYPKPNSLIHWETDESWSLYWAKNSITDGKSSIDKAIGSSVENQQSFRFGEYWIYNIVYGIPLYIAGDFSVEAGRKISFTLGLIILFISFYFIKRLTSNENLAFFGVLIIASTSGFVIGTHCTRYDILTTLYITLSIYFIINIDRLLNREKKLFFLLGLYVGGTIYVSLHAVGFIIPSLFLLYIVFIKRKEHRIIFSLQSLLLFTGLFLPLLLTIILSLLGIGSKPLLISSDTIVQHNSGKATEFLSYGIKEFILVFRDKFFRFFDSNFAFLILPTITFIFLAVKDKVNILAKEKIILITTFTVILFLFYLIVLPGVWGVYTLFLLPIFVITFSFILNQFELQKSLNNYLIFFGLFIFLFSLNYQLSYFNNKYNKEKLVNTIEKFEDIVVKDPHSTKIIFANFQLTNVIENKEEINYYTNFVDERSEDYLNNLDSIFQEERINYVLDIAIANQIIYNSDYMQLKDYLSDIFNFELVEEETGIFEDADRDYFVNNSWVIPDTLKLYKVLSKKGISK